IPDDGRGAAVPHGEGLRAALVPVAAGGYRSPGECRGVGVGVVEDAGGGGGGHGCPPFSSTAVEPIASEKRPAGHRPPGRRSRKWQSAPACSGSRVSAGDRGTPARAGACGSCLPALTIDVVAQTGRGRESREGGD